MVETRLSLADPIPEIFDAANALMLAVDAHLGGDRYGAERYFEEANCQKVWAYLDAGWGKGARARYNFSLVENAPPHLPLAERPVPRMPGQEIKAAVKQRDGHHCRFCGMPVIDPRVRKAAALAYPDAVGWPRTDIGKHAAFTCMWLQYDHILPNSRGGTSTIDNIVVTCAPCNFGRMDTTLEEGRLVHPFDADRPKWAGHSTWDGLEKFVKGEKSNA